MGIKKTRINNNANNKKKSVRNHQKSKRITMVVIIALVSAISIGLIGFMTTSASHNNNSSSQNLTGNWMDVHGVGIYPSQNDGSIYLATHNGLFKKDVGNNSSNTTTGGWIEVGKDKSDFMGFTINPANPGVMYSSGHPQTGGNLGFRISDDYGETWQKVSDVTIPTPVDFHTMTTGNNPKIIYAASGMGDNVFISTDEGKNWTITSPPPGGQQVITLSTNQSNSNNVYAGTTGGLFSSIDQGKNWQKINDELVSGNDTMVTGIDISSDGKIAYAFAVPNSAGQSNSGFIIKSMDSGNTWSKTDRQITGAVFVSKFAFGNNGKVYVALTQDSDETGVASSVYSSNNNGKNWTIEGTNSKLLAGM